MDDWLIIRKEARRRKILSVGRRLEEVWSSRFWNSAYVGGKFVRFYFILVFVGRRERGREGLGGEGHQGQRQSENGPGDRQHQHSQRDQRGAEIGMGSAGGAVAHIYYIIIHCNIVSKRNFFKKGREGGTDAEGGAAQYRVDGGRRETWEEGGLCQHGLI